MDNGEETGGLSELEESTGIVMAEVTDEGIATERVRPGVGVRDLALPDRILAKMAEVQNAHTQK